MNLEIRIEETVEPNYYHLDTEKDWLCVVHFNGHYTVEQQLEMLEKFKESLKDK